MSRPIVAIVGRPNTGKSTLFNRLIGRRRALVDRQPGLTRDRLYGVAEWRGRELSVVDTAGLDLGRGDASRSAIEVQTRVAMEEAQAIVFLLDARAGVTALDRDIADLLRRSRRPVVVAANKVDEPGRSYLEHEVVELGFADPVVISGQHGIGMDELLDRVLAVLPTPQEGGLDAAPAARLAIMGRPNVGKSSLLNRILGDERAVVSETPGTTRDPVDTELSFDGRPVVLVDTAGVRRRRAARDRLEHYSLLRGIRVMERSDAVLLVLEAPEAVLHQDQQLASYALEAGKGLVLVVNKIDLIEPARRRSNQWQRLLAAEFPFARHAPAVLVSAATGQGVERILPTALEVVERRQTRVPTHELNRVLREAFYQKPPPSYKGKRLTLKFATQAASEIPTFVLFVNDVALLHFGYRRYLENRLREQFGFAGSPIRLVLRSDREKAPAS